MFFTQFVSKQLLQKLGPHLPKVPCRSIYQVLRTKADQIINISEEVLEGLHRGKPIVALESAIITHGLPRPENLRIAKEVEDIVRQNGSIPATIGIVDGTIYVGMSDHELELLARYDDPIKVSKRDFPYVLSQKMTGGTTVSGTMLIADRVGIQIFTTGGIGGVHRHGESSLDISSDLIELGRTPMTVISAGVKSILDIGRTLEYLETQGVCVTTFGPSREFPAFFTAKSGFQVASNVDTPEAAAKLIFSRDGLEIGGGILIAVPIPEGNETESQVIEEAITKAVAEAEIFKLRGKAVTPFILKKVHELTKGKSVELNQILIKNNAKVGSLIAVELAKLNARKNIAQEKNQFGGSGTSINPKLLSFQTHNYMENIK